MTKHSIPQISFLQKLALYRKYKRLPHCLSKPGETGCCTATKTQPPAKVGLSATTSSLSGLQRGV